MGTVITELNNEDARRYLLNSDSYCNFNLPCYFNFQPLLDKLAACSDIPETPNKDFLGRLYDLEQDKVNHVLYTNKDGKLAWRPLQLINPIAYVYIVKILTQEKIWSQIVERFKAFQANKNIVCCSLPVADSLKPSTGNTISTWYTEFEKQAIKKSLDFNCMLTTDIYNCYSSIYTHSIAWAINPDGREGCKEELHTNNRKRHTKIHNAIDKSIQNISYGQTNGIPQGSVLMDFIAEMVLGYADLLLSEKIKKDENLNKNGVYFILRYRDDYKIFTKNKTDAEKIARYLCEILLSLNLKLNETKTQITESIITNAQKSDKIYWRNIKEIDSRYDTRILQIHSLSEKHPNSGTLLKILTKYYEDIESNDLVKEDLELITCVTADIAFNNPKTYPYAVAIIGRTLSLIENDEAKKIIEKIYQKFLDVPNSAYLNIWLQRLSKMEIISNLSDGELCNYVRKYTSENHENNLSKIWDYSKYPQKISNIFKENPIVSLEQYDSMHEYPKPDEVKVFQKYQ